MLLKSENHTIVATFGYSPDTADHREGSFLDILWKISPKYRHFEPLPPRHHFDATRFCYG